MCFDGVKRLCHIRGKLRKKVWIAQSDIVLVGLRDYQDAKADVILKYSPDEARNLKSYGEFPNLLRLTRPSPLAKKDTMTKLSSTKFRLTKRMRTTLLLIFDSNLFVIVTFSSSFMHMRKMTKLIIF